MKPSIAASIVAWSLIALPSLRAESPEVAKQVPQYAIACRLVEVGADGREQQLSAPVVMTTEAMPAEVSIGSETPVANGPKAAAPLREGIECKLSVDRGADGRLYLDARVEHSRSLDNKKDRVRMAIQGVRILEPVTLGEKLVVPVTDLRGRQPRMRFEVTVTAAKR